MAAPAAPPRADASLQLAPLSRRLASVIYEAILLTAVLWLAALAYELVEGLITPGHARRLFQLYLLGVCGVYFVWQWTHGGQTLPMKTWRIRVVTAEGEPVAARQAWMRYGLACLSFLGVGLGYAWALFDRDQQFLHDRLAGTRIVKAEERP